MTANTEMTKEEFIKLSENRVMKADVLKHLKDLLGDVFSHRFFPLENLSHRYDKVQLGDNIIEGSSKYKNYYKKVFNPKQIFSPFAASQMIEVDYKRIWVYVDKDDKMQGPFSSAEMDNWYNKQLLPLDLLLGLANRERFVKLSDFISCTYPFDKNPELYHTKKHQKNMSKHYTHFMTPQPQSRIFNFVAKP